MVVLATHLDGPQTVSHIQEKIGNYLHAGTGDVAGGLRYFLLESGLSETRLFVQVRLPTSTLHPPPSTFPPLSAACRHLLLPARAGTLAEGG